MYVDDWELDPKRLAAELAQLHDDVSALRELTHKVALMQASVARIEDFGLKLFLGVISIGIGYVLSAVT